MGLRASCSADSPSSDVPSASKPFRTLVQFGTISAVRYGFPSPQMTAWSMQSVATRSPSKCGGTTFLPLDKTISSFFRPVMVRKPSSSSEPRSPVRSQPSWIASFVALGLFQYPFITWGPRVRTSPSGAILMSTPGIARPTVPIFWLVLRLKLITGELSVKP